MGTVVKPESKSPIPCPNKPQMLTLSSAQQIDQVDSEN